MLPSVIQSYYKVIDYISYAEHNMLWFIHFITGSWYLLIFLTHFIHLPTLGFLIKVLEIPDALGSSRNKFKWKNLLSLLKNCWYLQFTLKIMLVAFSKYNTSCKVEMWKWVNYWLLHSYHFWCRWEPIEEDSLFF